MKPNINHPRTTILSLAAIATIALTSWVTQSSEPFQGAPVPLGNGEISHFISTNPNGTPKAVGIALSEAALQGLPAAMNSYSRCHDVNGDGNHGHHECIGDYETIFEIPADVATATGIPFRWISVNWNPEGHPAPAPPGYNKPHFDFHFYTADKGVIDGIAPGSCGELVDCEHFKIASQPVPEEYLPPDHIDVGAVVPGMGNHLLDAHSPELQNPPREFTRTFIYGSFAGELIFWEPMITLDFLIATDNQCFDIRMPQKVRTAGHYPSAYCIRLDRKTGARSVTLERFVYKPAN